jgi:fumarate reductase (CoM/CoB) subunit B
LGGNEMSQEVVTLKVYRFDPEGTSDPHYEDYQIPYSKGMTILDGLIYIYENKDASLSFRWSCKNVQCGTCGVMADGKAVLACERQLKAAEVVRIDPMPFPVIKDVVSDFSSIEDKEVRVLSKLRPAGRPERLSPEEVSPLVALHKCLDCHICDVVCPLNKGKERIEPGSFLPADLVQLASVVFNKREGGDRVGSAISKRVYDCLTCGECVKACPVEIDIVGDAIERLREELMKGNGEPYRKLFSPKDWVERWVELKGSPFLSEAKEEYGVANSKGRVGFFVGCLMNRRDQELAHSAIHVLNKAKYEVVVPKGQTCCGQPLARLGMGEEAKELLRRNISVFEEMEVQQVVTACPDCSFAFREDYRRLLGEGDRKPRFDVSDVITLLPMDSPKTPAKVACHNPCYLSRQGIRLSEELKKRGFEIGETVEECCGAGGGVYFTNPGLAQEIGRKTVQGMKSDILVTGCPFCKEQLSKVTGQKIKTIHYIEALNK